MLFVEIHLISTTLPGLNTIGLPWRRQALEAPPAMLAAIDVNNLAVIL